MASVLYCESTETKLGISLSFAFCSSKPNFIFELDDLGFHSSSGQSLIVHGSAFGPMQALGLMVN